MKTEYRRELLSVKKQLAALTKETRAGQSELQKQVRIANRKHEAELTALHRDFRKLFKRHERARERLTKRQQILKGRLS
jgi:hypothetical protein